MQYAARVNIVGLARTLLGAGLLIVGCGGDKAPADKPARKPIQPQVESEAEAKAKANPDAPLRQASTDTLRVHIETLASDDFQGRRPGTEGGAHATQYIQEQMRYLGLDPAGDDGEFRQRVPMRGVTLDQATATFELRGGTGAAATVAAKTGIVAGSFAKAGPHKLTTQVVFAGYGITAPEYEWDDYAGLDVKGKTVVVFVGDPPVDDGRFRGKAMTYYGRWSYKFERALEAGAAACLVIHETEPASYGWHVVESSWSGERFGLRESDDSLPPSLQMQGWLHRDVAMQLAERAGTSLQQWHQDAIAPGFTGRPLGVTLAAQFQTSERTLQDDNIVGRIPGSTNPEQTVLITAHWDHLGLAPEPVDNDVTFNGAVDNASGIAGMLATAAAIRQRVHAGQGPKRSVVFLATTAEEQGLLGSRHYAANPTVPLADIVGVANLDSMNVHGRTKNIIVVGAGQSTLEDTLTEVAAEHKRRVEPDDRPESGGYYRSDHFSFARRGVPAIYFRGGLDMEDGGTEAGAEIAKLRSTRYHTMADEYDAQWSLEGTLQDVEALTELVVRVANADRRPAWKPASEFAKVR